MAPVVAAMMQAVGSVGGAAGAGSAATGAAAAAGTALKTAATIGAGLAAGNAFSSGPMKGPATPTRDEAKEAQQINDRLRRRRGTAATILTSPLGTSAPQTAAKTLLGQ